MNKETKNEVIVIPASVQEKYFLISKRRVAIWLGVLAVLYLFVVLSSEFVFSVTSLSEKQAAQLRTNMQKIPCGVGPSDVEPAKIPKRNPWLLERYRIYGDYTETLFSHPTCAALGTIGTLADPHGKFLVYYFDRATDKPVIKVTYESLK